MMKYNRCGRSGVLLPAISLGLWHNFGSVDVFSTAEAIIKTAFDKGITHFDLANNYPVPGSAEENFGKIVSRNFNGFLRDQLLFLLKRVIPCGMDLMVTGVPENILYPVWIRA